MVRPGATPQSVIATHKAFEKLDCASAAHYTFPGVVTSPVRVGGC